MQKHGWDMRETSILDNKKCKTQAHARMCEENKLEELELEKKMTSIESILQLKVRVWRII